MLSQMYGVSYCLFNSYAIVFRHNRRFNYRPQFQDRQKPHPLISRRAVRRRHCREIIKSLKTVWSAVEVEATTFRTAATDDYKDCTSNETATAAYNVWWTRWCCLIGKLTFPPCIFPPGRLPLPKTRGWTFAPPWKKEGRTFAPPWKRMSGHLPLSKTRWVGYLPLHIKLQIAVM